MNAAHFHVVINHYPIVLTVLSALLLVLALATKSGARLKFALEIMVVAAFLSWPAFLSGEEAEEFLEHDRPDLLDPAAGHAIHEHEEWGERAHYATQAFGALALLAWPFCRKAEKFRPVLATLGLALVAGAGGLMLYAGKLGGEVRRPELRDVAAPPSDANAPTLSPFEQTEENGDDH